MRRGGSLATHLGDWHSRGGLAFAVALERALAADGDGERVHRVHHDVQVDRLHPVGVDPARHGRRPTPDGDVAALVAIVLAAYHVEDHVVLLAPSLAFVLPPTLVELRLVVRTASEIPPSSPRWTDLFARTGDGIADATVVATSCRLTTSSKAAFHWSAAQCSAPPH